MTDISETVLSPPSVAVASAAPPSVIYERALTLAAMGLYKEAIKALRDISIRAPEHGPGWQKFAELLRLAGKDQEASDASARAVGLGPLWPPPRDERTPAEILAAEQELRKRISEFADPDQQWRPLQDHLREHETDVAAMRLLACMAADAGNAVVARNLLQRALELAPRYERARKTFVSVLLDGSLYPRALEEIQHLLARAPDDVDSRTARADALRAIGDMEAAISILEELVRENPTIARLRCMYARVLRFAGRPEDSAREYRAALELRPGSGAAYAGLAKLRGEFLTSDDVAAMREHLRGRALDDDNRQQIQFALGQALERMGDFAGSFLAYQTRAALAKDPDYDITENIREIRRRCAVFTARTVARCAPETTSSGITPIFVVGMPRAGSTLVEQILASHSQVEGTLELPVLGAVINDLSRSRLLVTPQAYPERVADLTPEQLSELGARYIRDAAPYRKTGLPYFVDKRPWNWMEAGLIRMILPHAKIVDVRREPMAACFGMYKQDMDEALFTNDFNDSAQYYTEYVSTMRHYDKVMPGRIHLVHYRQLVEDTEAEIRRLLDFCGLPFEENCLRFWETSRSVATPSAEQVRRPIFREGLDQWRNFEPWLGPLKQALETASAADAPPQPEGYDLGLTLAAMSIYEDAIKELQAVTRRVPSHHGAWKKLAELLRLAGKDKQADDAEAKAIRSVGEATNWRPSRDVRTSKQLEAGKRALESSIADKDRAQQMAALRIHLTDYPADAAATYLLSGLESLDCDEFTAIALLERTLDLSPCWHAAREEFVAKLLNRREYARALEQAALLARDAIRIPAYQTLRAEVLENSGNISEAITIIEELLRDHPRSAGLWLRYGNLLRTTGKREESARAFRTCLEISPKIGDAYAALADLKGDLLTEADVNTIREKLADPSLEPAHRMRMHYALGHALERRGDFAASFASYQAAARLIRGSFLGRGEAYNEKANVERVHRMKRFFTARILSRSPASVPTQASVTPIFVVGMPRAGSTLVEQILGSHSRVEATRELSLIADIVRELAFGRRIKDRDAYPDCLRDMTAAQLAGLGERYIERAREFRHTDRPWFVDKRPWNWLDAGLIHLILPQAKIIDIRREPMSACFAMYKQQLPKDAAFSYDLGDLGRYYNIYLSLMEHWKQVMPGRIHFVQYERLVEDTENEIRRMLDYCGVPFEENCLRFWETDRAVLTPSAEQVRRPIYRDAVEQWRNFEPWLGPLKEALSQPPLA
jgi:tetratricopeptide (TPR) repeat protein